MQRECFVKKITEGKTKIIYGSPQHPTLVRIKSKDDVTAGNGARCEVIRGKGRLVNDFACDFFGVLGRSQVPNAFVTQHNEDSFLAMLCQMVKLEIVVRFESDPNGSYQKRHPTMPANHPFKKPVVEFFLKTSGRKWGDRDLSCDDPLLIRDPVKCEQYWVYAPSVPLGNQHPLFKITAAEIGLRDESDVDLLIDLARSAAVAFRDALASVRVKLIDLKMEVGYTPHGDLVIADLVSQDECRMETDISKQGFRLGDSEKVMRAKYALAAALSRNFAQ